MIKINKFIYNYFFELRKKYQFEYYNKLFWSETTCSIEYDYNNYKFTNKSGLSFLQGKVEVINTRVDVHTQLEKFLGGLLNQIRNTLPSSRAKDLLKLYEEIKQSSTY